MRQKITGRCPACRCEGTLFVADGDYITCSLNKCPDPTLVSSLLNDEGYSIVSTADILSVCDEIERIQTKLSSGINLVQGIPTNSPGTKLEHDMRHIPNDPRLRF